MQSVETSLSAVKFAFLPWLMHRPTDQIAHQAAMTDASPHPRRAPQRAAGLPPYTSTAPTLPAQVHPAVNPMKLQTV